MNTENFIQIKEICLYYKVETSFLEEVEKAGLVELATYKKERYLHLKYITTIEKILRLHTELRVNIEGIDVIFNLLDKMGRLQEELNEARDKIELYEKG